MPDWLIPAIVLSALGLIVAGFVVRHVVQQRRETTQIVAAAAAERAQHGAPAEYLGPQPHSAEGSRQGATYLGMDRHGGPVFGQDQEQHRDH